MMIVIAGVGISACGDDGDDEGTGIEGTWTGVDGSETLQLTFKSDYTGVWVVSYNNKYSGSGSEKGTFTYSMSGSSKGIITIKSKSSSYSYSSSGSHTEIIFFEIEGNTMYLYEDGYGDDLEWILTKGTSGKSFINNNDDDDANVGGEGSSIIGSWFSEGGNKYLSLTFNNNGSGSWVIRATDSYSGTETKYGTLTYTMSSSNKGTIYMKYEGYDFLTWTFVIEGSKMYVYHDGSSQGVLYKQ